jgi:hypothetical protein
MRKILPLFLFSASSITGLSQSVAVNTDGTTSHPSAIMDIKSSFKGMLVPRMTTTQRTAILNPANGLLVYDTDNNSFQFFNNTAWTTIATGVAPQSIWKQEGNAGTSSYSHFIGTTDNQSLVIRTNNEECGRFDPVRRNYFIGHDAGLSNYGGEGSGGFNIAIGFGALRSNVIKHRLIAIGDSALFNNGTGANFTAGWAVENTAVGSKALYANTTGSGNTAIGFNALKSNVASNNNTVIGASAMVQSVSGYDNTVTGYYGLHDNTGGDGNSSYGVYTLQHNTTGSANAAFGNYILRDNLIGHSNAALGNYALSKTTSNWNTGIGVDALTANTSGNKNTAVGYSSMISNYTGINNSAFGANADVVMTNLDYATAIGAGARVACDNCLVLGGTGAAKAKVGINTTTPATDMHIVQQSDASGNNTRGIRLERSIGVQWRMYIDILNNLTFEFANGGSGNWGWINQIGTFVSGSDKRIKKNVSPMESSLEKIMLLRPKTYHYTQQGNDEPLQAGFLAQEVEEIFPGFVSTREDGIKGIVYQNFGIVAIKAIQEQQQQIIQQSKEIMELKTQNETVLERLKALESILREQVK